MRTKERTNIPITVSVLHDQEYRLYRLLQHLHKRRAFTERHIRSHLSLQQEKIRQPPVLK